MRFAPRAYRRAATALVIGLVVSATGAPSAQAAPSRINGSGSTYVAQAMQQWVADAQTQGLSVNYLPTGSPDGLTTYGQSLTDFAGTEAEFSALRASAPRGFQYVPDVGGAIAVMYHVYDKAGRKVDYLHLSMRTIAAIFTGNISNWSDPAISADNVARDGTRLQLPNQPIKVIYRSGQSGTTALFYDFVAHAAPDLFGAWAARFGLPTNVRIIQLDGTPNFAPNTQGMNGSDAIAQAVATKAGEWSIAYDEFAFAKLYNAPAAWVKNASGNWVLPYAQNISAALESARLRSDLSQELAGVYASPNPEAYPISAYSYLVTQCVRTGDRPTCAGAYANPGVIETLTRWMRYIACEGQVNMASIGYSPLPPNLSQEMANSIGRLKGTAPEGLNAANCANPRFRGSLGAGASSPKDPLVSVASLSAAGAETAVGGATAGATAEVAGARELNSAAGGSGISRADDPTACGRHCTPIPGTPAWPLLALLGVIVVPAAAAGGVALYRRRRGVVAAV